jgi:hypothetical protein
MGTERYCDMEFIWNDGGRASSGFVGTTGDCVVRSISIATGMAYRSVYDQIGEASLRSPRNGVDLDCANNYLAANGWTKTDGRHLPFDSQHLPKGIVIADLAKANGRSCHFCAVIDHVIHDTWNPADDTCYFIQSLWISPVQQTDANSLRIGPKRTASREQELTQGEFEKILKRLRALENTANNGASAEGEKRNALRMMQNLMLRHNLTRDDIRQDDDVDNVSLTRRACPLNGRRAYGWEKSLAWYVTKEIFPMVQWYYSTKGHRTLIWFYGPVSDVENTIELFRELLLTIAAAAHLRFGGYTRGSGASYAEGYVAGLPRYNDPAQADTQPIGTETSGTETSVSEQTVSQHALIHARTIAIHGAAVKWLGDECDVHLTTSSARQRDQHDAAAASLGKKHGATHQVTPRGLPPRIGSSQ